MIKKINITDILTAAAVSAAMLMYGAEEWYFCIIPLALILAVCFIKLKRASRSAYGIFLLIMLLSSIAALCLGQTDKHRGIYGLEILMSFFAAFFAGGAVSDRAKIKKYIFIGALLSAVTGLVSYCGILRIDEFVMLDHAVRRLQSVFRYANTAAVIFGCAYYLSLDIFDDKNIWGRAVSMLTLAAMYLTFSKAVIPMFLVIGFALAVLRRDKRGRFAADNGICIILAAVLLALYVTRGAGGYAPAETMVKRLVYMRDALSALKEHALTGAGSGAWRYLQYAVQSAGYSVSHIHNGWLEFWLENGIVFVLCLIFLTVSAVYAAVKSADFTAAASITLIAVHSLVDFDMSFGSVLIVYGLLLGACLYRESKKAIVTNICIMAVMCASVVYMGAEYIVRRSFEVSYIEQRHDEAVSRAYALERLCPYDSELRVSIAALDRDNAAAEIDTALLLSPLDPEIVRAKAEYELETGGGVIAYLTKYIGMAPKRESVYARAQNYAKAALDKGLCTKNEYDEFMTFAGNRRILEGVTDRNKLLEEIADKRSRAE